jgi:predicted nucleic acid-binding protein
MDKVVKVEDLLRERIRAEYVVALSPRLQSERIEAEKRLGVQERSELADKRVRDVVAYARQLGYPSAMELYLDPRAEAKRLCNGTNVVLPEEAEAALTKAEAEGFRRGVEAARDICADAAGDWDERFEKMRKRGRVTDASIAASVSDVLGKGEEE